MSTAIKFTFLAALFCMCFSCSIDGRIYTDKIVPYSKNFHPTPVGSKVCYVNDFKVQEPISGYNLSAEWMTSRIIAQAREANIEKIYYADLRIFSILFGIYSRKTLIVYGD